jgi:hypothetical protein
MYGSYEERECLARFAKLGYRLLFRRKRRGRGGWGVGLLFTTTYLTGDDGEFGRE